MKLKKVSKRAYLTPCTEVCFVRIEGLMLANSPVGGGHSDAPDDPSGGLSAKRYNFAEENIGWASSYSPWEE